MSGGRTKQTTFGTRQNQSMVLADAWMSFNEDRNSRS